MQCVIVEPRLQQRPTDDFIPMIPYRLRPILPVGRGKYGVGFAQCRVGSLRRTHGPNLTTYCTTASKSHWHKDAHFSFLLLATTCGFLCYVSAHKIFNDSNPSPALNRSLPPVGDKNVAEQNALFTIVWGSNRLVPPRVHTVPT
jgi:hypothetical protein